MVKVVSRSAAIAAVLAAGIIHTSLAAPITSNWTPGNVGNWSGGAAADAANWNHSQPPTAPSTQTFPNNNAQDTYSVDIGGGSSSTVNLNLNVTVDSLQVGATNTLNLNNGTNLSFVSGASVSNNQNINLNSSGSSTAINFSGNASVTGSGTITLGNHPSNRIHQIVGGGIITHGAGHTIRGAGSVLAGIGGMDNAGTIIADQTNILTIDPGADPFNNTGTLRAQNGATLRLQSGTFNNAGGSIEADGAGSNVDLFSTATVINGGTLTTTNGGQIRSTVNAGPLLNGVTLSAGSNFVQGDGADARIQGNLVNDGTWNLNSGGQQTFLQFLGSQSLTGTGEIVMGQNVQNDLILLSNTNILTQAAGHTIRGAGDILQGVGGMINNGTIRQQGAVALTIDPGTTNVDGNGNNFINNGTLRSEGTGGLTLNTGTFLNAGQTIESVGGGDIRLNSTSTVIRGGTFDISGGGVLRSTVNAGAQLDAVTITAATTVQQTNGEDFRIFNGLTNDGTWNLNSAGQQTFLQFLGSQTLTGNGEVVMGQNAQNDVLVSSNIDTLTLDTNQTIRGAGDILQGVGGLINNGTILQQGGVALTIDPGTTNVDGNGNNFVNNGTLRSEGTGGLTLNSGTYLNTGNLIESTGGGDIRLASTSTVIRGGTLAVSGGGVLRSTVNAGAQLDTVLITAGTNFLLEDGSDVRIFNGLTNDGTINMNSNGQQTFVQFQGSQTLTGSGEVVMGQNAQNDVLVSSNIDTLTLDTNQTIRGAGDILQGVGGMINNGTIRQQGAVALTIDPGTTNVDGNGNNFVNNGTLRSEGTGGLTLNSGTYLNAGNTIQSTGGGDVRLASTSTVIRGGTFDISGGGILRSTVNAGAQLDAVTIASGTNVVQNNGEDFRVFNGLTNDGTWNLNSGGQQTFLRFHGSQTLTGSGEVVMGQNAQNDVLVSSNIDTLTLDTNQTIRGAGDILQGVGGMINQGTILQQGAVALTIDPGTTNVDGNGNNFVNNGTLRSEGAGGLNLNTGNYLNNTAIESVGGGDIRLTSTSTVIRGGSLTTSGGGIIRSTVNAGAQLDGVTITGGTNVVQTNGEDFRIRNGLTNNGNWNLNSGGQQTFVQFLGSQTLSGTGEIVMGNNVQNDLTLTSNVDVLTQAAGHTIRGAGDILQGVGGMINQGNIIADQTVRLRIDAGGNFSQQGLLRVSGTGGLEIDGNAAFTQAAGLTDIQANRQATVTFGDYVQTGGETRVTGTLATTSVNSNIQLQGGRLTGTGLVDFNGLGVHVLNNSGGTLAAGASPGVLTVQDGNYVQGAGGTFEFELDGFVAGVGHDLLNIVNGDADLGGDLSIVADQLFASTLSIGDQFEVVRLDQSGVFIDGDLDLAADVFDTISINLAGLNFSQLFIGNSLWIEVTQADVLPPGADPVPEPQMILLMMFGLTAIFWMRRRQVAVTTL